MHPDLSDQEPEENKLQDEMKKIQLMIGANLKHRSDKIQMEKEEKIFKDLIMTRGDVKEKDLMEFER